MVPAEVHVFRNNNQKIQTEKSETNTENTDEEFKDHLKGTEII